MARELLHRARIDLRLATCGGAPAPMEKTNADSHTRRAGDFSPRRKRTNKRFSPVASALPGLKSGSRLITCPATADNLAAARRGQSPRVPGRPRRRMQAPRPFGPGLAAVPSRVTAGVLVKTIGGVLKGTQTANPVRPTCPLPAGSGPSPGVPAAGRRPDRASGWGRRTPRPGFPAPA